MTSHDETSKKRNEEDHEMSEINQEITIYKTIDATSEENQEVCYQREAPSKNLSLLEQGSPLLSGSAETDNDLETQLKEDDTLCGLGPWKPFWLQRLASKKSYVLLYGFTGMCLSCIGSYLVATISTLEKRFKIPSRTTGVIVSAWDIGAIFSVIGLSYLGSLGHKTRWVAVGIYLVALSCVIRALPHLIYGPGQDALELTYEFAANSTNITLNEFADSELTSAVRRVTGVLIIQSTAERFPGKIKLSIRLLCREREIDISKILRLYVRTCSQGMMLKETEIDIPRICKILPLQVKQKPVHGPPMCGNSETDDDCQEGIGIFNIPAALLFLGHFITGIGSSTYYTLGIAYLDDNIKKDKAPVLLAISQCLRLLGPTFGFLTASYALAVYIDPSLHPIIDKDDPRWIGAWWMGWLPMGMVACVFATILMLFPRELPRTAQRKKVSKNKPVRKTSFKDFISTCQRLFRNKVLLLNTFSGVSFMFGFIGYWTFMPKYMETQYRQSAAKASLITGSVGLIFSALGLLTSALVISKFKPRPRVLAAWNVFVECIEVIGHLSWAFLSCWNENLHGSWSSDKTWNLTAECNLDCDCGPTVKYSPICSADGNITFYSACHAGCTASETIGEIMRYSNCTCVDGGLAIEGSCPVDCSYNFIIFLTTQCIMRLLGSSGRAGNILIQIRCVDEDDKSLSIAFTEMLLQGLALIPGPIVYGLLLDQACLVWGQTCGQSGNCWLYDGQTLRYLLNFTAAVFLTIGTLLDIGVWYYCKDLQIYDNKEEYKTKEVLNNARTDEDSNRD